MLRKIIVIGYLFLGILHAATISTNKSVYESNESIVANFTEMLGDTQDWIGIYPAGSSNDWANVIQWEWSGGDVTGAINFSPLSAGVYEVRAFYQNSFNVEASYTFTIEDNGSSNPVLITLDKESYTPNESIQATFENMTGNNKDWIGIYPAGSSNDWKNMIQWNWTGGVIDGSINFNDLPVGEYEVRAFFNNSLNVEAQQAFTVKAEVNNSVILTTNKTSYLPNELIYVNFDRMLGNPEDWIGIYPAGASYEFSNVIEWRKTNGKVQGKLSLDGLPAGSYDVRAFFDNSLTKEATATITVQDVPVSSTVYEDAENGLNPNWIHVAGSYAPRIADQGYQSNKALVLVPQWVSNTLNIAEYQLPLNSDNSKKVLEVDVGGLSEYKLPNNSRYGYIPHYSIGVYVHTIKGERRMIWDSFFNHGNVEPFISTNGIELNFPSPVEHVRGYSYEPDITKWEHFKVNIEQQLRVLEPDNSIVSIDTFKATGGFLDNLKLSNY